MRRIGNYLSLVKFSHTVFALPFACIGFFLALKDTHYEFQWIVFAKMLLCMVFARSAAMAFNRYIDRHIDSKNPRTSQREIPQGIISSNSALAFVIANCLLFIITTYFINSICLLLSPVALVIILVYSLLKRYTALCHLALGLGLSLAPIGAYLSITGKFNVIPLFYSAIVLLWVSGFDIIYALQDEEFDKSLQLKSIPVLLGPKSSLDLSSLLHFLTIPFLLLVGIYSEAGYLYWIGAAIFSILLFRQHRIVKPNDLSKVNLAFFTLNGFASIIFGIFVVLEILRG